MQEDLSCLPHCILVERLTPPPTPNSSKNLDTAIGPFFARMLLVMWSGEEMRQMKTLVSYAVLRALYQFSPSENGKDSFGVGGEGRGSGKQKWL